MNETSLGHIGQILGEILVHHRGFRYAMVLFHMLPFAVLRSVRFATYITFELSLVRVRRHIMSKHMAFDEEPHTADGTFVRTLL